MSFSVDNDLVLLVRQISLHDRCYRHKLGVLFLFSFLLDNGLQRSEPSVPELMIRVRADHEGLVASFVASAKDRTFSQGLAAE